MRPHASRMAPPSIVRIAGAFLRREFAVVRSYRLAFLPDLVGTVFVLVEFRLLSKIVDADSVGGDYFVFVTTGLVVAALVATGVAAMAVAVRQEQSQGTLEPLLATGLSPARLSAGIAAWPIVAGVLRSVLYMGVAMVAGASFSHANWGVAVSALGLGTVAFAGLGLVGVGIVILFRQAAGAIGWAVGLLTVAAGSVFPPELLPAWVRTLASVSPVTRTLELVRAALLNGASWSDVAGKMGLSFALSVICVTLGVVAVARALRWSTRSGSLAQY
jgi:ABC-2 type transport system permease protein